MKEQKIGKTYSNASAFFNLQKMTQTEEYKTLIGNTKISGTIWPITLHKIYTDIINKTD